MAIHSIELCAGVGMLGEGVRAGFEFFGIDHRTVCYVEREASAASQLVALMEAGVINPAPIWSDMLTFDGSAWRGKVDCVIAGFPCQDLSVAGARKGLDGERSGLFFNVLDVADDCGAQLLILENVAGIASATATVVDPEEGELEERAASRVVGELADRGWSAEWIALSASEVGASHRRARWFCFAWRMADSARHERDGEGREAGSGRRVSKTGEPVGSPKGDDGWCKHKPGSAWSGRAMPSGDGSAMAHTSGARREGCEQLGARNGNRGGEEAHGSASELCRAFPIFAPGPGSEEWSGIIDRYPFLAPATESGVRMLVNGMACVVDESRSHQLRAIGNGVVPLQAAVAVVELVRRSGLSGKRV